MASLDYTAAADILQRSFDRVQRDYSAGQTHQLEQKVEAALTKIFQSKTSAFREAFLGCVLAKLTNSEINPKTAYIDFGPDAFSGRSLDERVVNPFFQANQIPSSKSPYLSVLRRSVRFDNSMRRGVKDKAAFDSFVFLLGKVDSKSSNLLERVLEKFLQLREESVVTVATVPQAGLNQLQELSETLLSTPSGGRLPVLLTVAALRAVSGAWNLGWNVEFQGINVADQASKAGADISVFLNDELILALEVTERPVEASRVQATYKSKISPLAIRDYLFVVELKKVADDAIEQARKYFAQGHDVNFVNLRDWLFNVLATIGRKGRTAFTGELVGLISARDVPAALKLEWNKAVYKLTS